MDDSSDRQSRQDLGRFVELWLEQRPGEDAGELSGADGKRFRVSFSGGSHGSYPLTYFDMVSPASEWQIRRIDHHMRDGVGTPLVAVRKNRHLEPIEKFYPDEIISRPLTAVISGRPQGNSIGTEQVEVSLLCPLQNDEVVRGGKKYPLAADFTVPWASLLSLTGGLERNRYLDAIRKKPKRSPRLYLMEPYDAEKEPLIMIHGLFDTPLVWAKLSNTLWADDTIRRRYQIWHYLYNTSAPPLYSARILRDQLHEVRALLDPTGKDPAMLRTSIITHSMGGIVSRGLTTRPGNAFWDAAFTKPIDQLELSDADRTSLRNAFFWEPASHVRRVIYMAVPHRGSDFADNLLGRLGKRIVDPPPEFAAFYARISTANPGAFTPDYALLGSGHLGSVHSLSPKQPTMKILPKLPYARPIRTHSIIGNKHPRRPLEKSTDGIVEYWSSHLDDADSEAIIPSGHYLIDHPDTLAELRRILSSG